MTMLHEIQSSFIHDIYTGERTSAAFLDGAIGSLSRLDIYYNNTLLGLTDILASAFPVIQKVLGEDFFKTLAQHYIKAYPQPMGNRHSFGAHLSDYLRSFEAAQDMPYLPDVAALEWAYFQAGIADDAAAINFDRLMENLSSQPDLCLALHPSACMVDQRFDALDIWEEHQKPEVGLITLTQEDHVIFIWRDQEDTVLIRKISPAFETFITLCRDGEDFGSAIATVTDGLDHVEAFQQEFAEAISLGVFMKNKGERK